MTTEERKVIEDFIKKIDLIHNDADYVAVFAINQLRTGLAYEGPTYTDELAALRKLIE